MKAEKENYRVNMMARVLEVSRSGFYRWLKTEAAQTPDPYGELKEHIEEIWLKSRKRFGYRKIHAVLRNEPDGRFRDVTRYRVHKCMQELGIRGICPNRSKQTTVPDEDAPMRPDLLRRDFTSAVPTTRLVGDITYLPTLTGFIYLATVIDLATRMVVGWAIADNMKADIVVRALAMAHGRGYVAGNAIFHSDYAAENAMPHPSGKRQLRGCAVERVAA